MNRFVRSFPKNENKEDNWLKGVVSYPMGQVQCILITPFACVGCAPFVGGAAAAAGFGFKVKKERFQKVAAGVLAASLVVFLVAEILIWTHSNSGMQWGRLPVPAERPLWNNAATLGNVAAVSFALACLLGCALTCYGSVCCTDLDVEMQAAAGQGRPLGKEAEAVQVLR